MRMKRQIILMGLLVCAGICAVLFLGYVEQRQKNIRVEDALSEENIQYIRTAEDLLDFSNKVNSGTTYTGIRVVLAEDIDLAKLEEFIPIGVYEEGHYFYGIFDGRGHCIRNMRITTERGKSNSGLFGTLAGTVCNLGMENCYVKGSACGAICSIAGSDTAGIFNCYVRNCEIEAPYTDGIGGQYYGRKENCIVDDEGNPSILNENLEEISNLAHGIPMMKWMEKTGRLALSDTENVAAEKLRISIKNQAYKGDIKPFYKDSRYYFVLPFSESDGSATLSLESASGKKNSYAIENPKIGQNCVEIELETENKKIPVVLCYSENVGSVLVNLDTKWGMDYLNASKLNFLSGTIQVVDEEGKANYKGGLEMIKGRGNDSWLAAKKGYGIKLLKDADLLGMGADKEYALLAGYRDSSLLTYMVTRDLIEEMHLEYAPQYRFVNYYVDGEYQGLYILAEKINIGYNRVNIDCSGKDETGGYLYEIDDLDYQWEYNYFPTEHNNVIVINEPTIVKQKQLEYSMNLWNSFEEAVYSSYGCNSKGRHYSEYMDVDSLAKLWLFYELGGEYSVSSSVNFYKDSDYHGDGKIHALYPWDMEHAYASPELMEVDVMNTVNADGTNGFWPAVYQHEDLRKAIGENWQDLFKPAIAKLMNPATGEQEQGVSYIDIYGEKYETASKWNELLWGEDQSIVDKGESIKTWMEIRVPYLDSILE